LLSGFVASVIAAPAMAADMPLKAPEPICVWCGFYVGGNIGYGFGSTRASGDTYYTGNITVPPGITGLWTLSDNLSGVLGGGQVGYNFFRLFPPPSPAPASSMRSAWVGPQAPESSGSRPSRLKDGVSSWNISTPSSAASTPKSM
jgi:hypothetical protein